MQKNFLKIGSDVNGLYQALLVEALRMEVGFIFWRNICPVIHVNDKAAAYPYTQAMPRR